MSGPAVRTLDCTTNAVPKANTIPTITILSKKPDIKEKLSNGAATAPSTAYAKSVGGRREDAGRRVGGLLSTTAFATCGDPKADIDWGVGVASPLRLAPPLGSR